MTFFEAFQINLKVFFQYPERLALEFGRVFGYGFSTLLFFGLWCFPLFMGLRVLLDDYSVDPTGLFFLASLVRWTIPALSILWLVVIWFLPALGIALNSRWAFAFSTIWLLGVIMLLCYYVSDVVTGDLSPEEQKAYIRKILE